MSPELEDDDKWHVVGHVAQVVRLVAVALSAGVGVLCGTGLVVRYGELHVEVRPCESRSSVSLRFPRSPEGPRLSAALSIGPRNPPSEYTVSINKWGARPGTPPILGEMKW